MRVLILSPSMYEGSLDKFKKNRNGFSLMVADIAKSLSKYDDVYVATYVITKKQNCGSVTIVDHSVWRILKNFRFRYLLEGMRSGFRHRVPLKLRLRYVYYHLNKACIKDILHEIKPDIVSIHGVSYASKMFMEACHEAQVKFSVTLHGLIGLNQSVRAYDHDRAYEKEFLLTSEKEDIPVSVISTGIKKRIVADYGLHSGNNISVIPNGTSLEQDTTDPPVDIRCLYGILTEQTVALCVGNITPNKNQIQVVHAYEKLPQNIKNKLTVLFLGNEVDNGCLRTLIDENGYHDHLILCGFVPRERLDSYYKAAGINLFPSLNDGFGLPIIEGFMHGIPAVSFADLDAIEDVYNDDAMLLVADRSDEALASAIAVSLEKEWNLDRILAWGKQFSLDKMAQNYHNFFEKGRV